ncbi:sentrin-specific protease 1-like [Drosophila bipectinata]|uniref:sentrin-specific protease 1-like n=1 Tax=Drosophila bipectinata TaxID=42026 RepID=UPI001C89F8F3|nr:sentrin-specific protease 1-like [Drosophila bipectinata]
MEASRTNAGGRLLSQNSEGSCAKRSSLKIRDKDGTNISILQHEELRSQHDAYLKLIENSCGKAADVPPSSLVSRAEKLASSAKKQQVGTSASLLQTFSTIPRGAPVISPASSEQKSYAELLERASKRAIQVSVNRQVAITSSAEPLVVDLTSSPEPSVIDITSSPEPEERMMDVDEEEEEKEDQLFRQGASPLNRPTNSLELKLMKSPYYNNDFVNKIIEQIARSSEEIDRRRQLAYLEFAKSHEERLAMENKLFVVTKRIVIRSLQPNFKKTRPAILDLEEHDCQKFNKLINGPRNEVLVEKFSMQIHRYDISTLVGGCWLNDKIINFYMNLLMDRSKRQSGLIPSVYAMNSFFLQRLQHDGYSAVQRWTRKVDLFSNDIVLVPVHCGSIHWCLAIIHLRDRTLKYYDSMGNPNQPVLNILESYLKSESLDKRKQPFDTECFRIESVPAEKLPQQRNLDDCGVFCCMYAEYISRDQEISFSQENMSYFRKKMVLDVCKGELD